MYLVAQAITHAYLCISFSYCRLQFFLTTLRTPTKEVAYYIGIQVAVDKKGPGQMPSNPGKSVRIHEIGDGYLDKNTF